jgi:hypothetical protein
VQNAFSFLKKREESIFHFNEEDSSQPMAIQARCIHYRAALFVPFLGGMKN